MEVYKNNGQNSKTPHTSCFSKSFKESSNELESPEA